MQRLGQINQSVDCASLPIESPDFIGIDFVARKNFEVRRQNPRFRWGVLKWKLYRVRSQYKVEWVPRPKLHFKLDPQFQSVGRLSEKAVGSQVVV
jgi:hypothetical protein